MTVEIPWRMWHKSRGWVGVCVGLLLMLSSGEPRAVFAHPGEDGRGCGLRGQPQRPGWVGGSARTRRDGRAQRLPGASKTTRRCRDAASRPGIGRGAPVSVTHRTLATRDQGVVAQKVRGAAVLAAQEGEANVEEEESLEQAAEEARRALDLFLRQEKIIFRPGEFGFELGMFYRTGTDEEFVSVGSLRSLAKITNRAGFATLTARVGLLRDLQFDVTLPIGVAKREIDVGVARLRRDDEGLGDITGRLRYGLWAERGARPDVILDVTATSGTTSLESLLGTGFWQVGGGVTLVKTIDPVVLFGRLGYTAVLERNGRDPADQFSYLFGTGFSLTDRVSVNARVSGIAGGRAQVNGRAIPGTSLDVLSMQFAVTTRVTRRLYVEPFVSAGLTDDAPDAVVGVSLVGVRFRPLSLIRP
jgi:hypothetical protein